MKSTLYRVTPGNYGDDLNSIIWPHYFPDIINDVRYIDSSHQYKGNVDETLFFGIGTILNEGAPPLSQKIIFGSGFGYDKPMAINEKCRVIFVRGPKTAKALGLKKELGITDPAVLIADCLDIIVKEVPKQQNRIGLMPHHASLYPAYKEICDELGFVFISPTDNVADVTKKLLSVQLLITEAMHGAICADALRVPWLPYKTNNKFNDFKWLDWLSTVDLAPEFATLPAIWERKPSEQLKRLIYTPIQKQIMKNNLRKLARSGRSYLSADNVHNENLIKIKNEVDKFSTEFQKQFA